MIIFDLACASGGHVFEAWFGSSEEFEAQKRGGLVQCPLCGCGEIAKAPMAPSVARGGARAREAAPTDRKAMLAAVACAQARALAGSTWVGERFAAEARAIHEGQAEQRQVHGRATIAEVRSLAEDGVPVAALPLPVVPPEEAN